MIQHGYGNKIYIINIYFINIFWITIKKNNHLNLNLYNSNNRKDGSGVGPVGNVVLLVLGFSPI